MVRPARLAVPYFVVTETDPDTAFGPTVTSICVAESEVMTAFLPPTTTFLAALRKYSGPFCWVMRPRNRTIFSSLMTHESVLRHWPQVTGVLRYSFSRKRARNTGSLS